MEDRLKAPERIWLADNDPGGWADDHRLGHTFAYLALPMAGSEPTEYVRADLVLSLSPTPQPNTSGNCRHGVPICWPCTVNEVEAHVKEKDQLRAAASTPQPDRLKRIQALINQPEQIPTYERALAEIQYLRAGVIHLLARLNSVAARQPDSTEQAREMVEAEFGTPLNSPMYQTAGRMIERLTKRIAAALDAARAGSLSPTDALGLNLFRQLVSGKNALRQLDVFSCNFGEHDAGCECFWEQCEQWAASDSSLPSEEKT